METMNERYYLTPQGKIGKFLGYEVTKVTRMTIYRLSINGAEQKVPAALLAFVPSEKLQIIKQSAR